MTQIVESVQISGVRLAKLTAFEDERGRFLETFRTEWFPERSWEKIQSNRSDSKAGVLRGLHFHLKQVDYWYCSSGRARVALADLRPHSPTYRGTQTIEIGEHNLTGVFIPTGVAHGFFAITDVTLLYIVDNYYTGEDEFGVAWDDPDLDIDWGVTKPILSPRDQQNARLVDLKSEILPQWGT